MNKDEKFVAEAIEMARQDALKGLAPFAALIVRDDVVLSRSTNLNGHHAEILAMQALDHMSLEDCTLYSNCEPCAMCSFRIRERRLKCVVYSVSSPRLGGVSRWDILTGHIGLEEFNPPPKVLGGLLEQQGRVVFDGIGWKMHRPE